VVDAKAARRYHLRKHRLLLSHSVRLFPCYVPVCPLRRECPPNEYPLSDTETCTHLRRRAIEVLRRSGAHDRLELGKRHDLWKTSPSSKYIPAPAYGKTGVSRNRFDHISACIRFNDQPKTQGEISSVRYRWMLVNDFVSAVNTQRRAMVTPSELLYVDESIARWYGQGGLWIDLGLPHYVSIRPQARERP
jgi:hypothetical protein